MAIIHTCSNCGKKFRFKFSDLTTCYNCHKDIHDDIDLKLSGIKEIETIKTKSYNKDYLIQHEARPVNKASAAKKTPENRKGIKIN